MKHIIIFLSPAGTTRQVAHAIVEQLDDAGQSAELMPVRDSAHAAEMARELNRRAEPLSIWVGSPVYVDHALEQILHLLDALNLQQPGWGAAFATFGGVTTGLALAELTERLQRADLPVPAIARILAQHSALWDVTDPLADGHPDERDLLVVRQLVEAVLQTIERGDRHPMPASVYDYQTEAARAEAAAKSLDILREHMPMPAADRERCVRCGACRQACPVDAIALEPWPERNAECIFCNQCVRVCQQRAYPHDSAARAERIWQMREHSAEEPDSRLFVIGGGTPGG